MASKTPSESRKSAKSQKENNGEGGEPGAGGKDPAAFTDALERGKAALDQMEDCDARMRLSDDPKESDSTTTSDLKFEMNASDEISLWVAASAATFRTLKNNGSGACVRAMF